MKLKITITGSKVHDVGYRPWLTEQAMDAYLRGFEVYNDEISGQQAVIALAEADEPRIKRFINSVKTMQPQLAKVNGITSEEYTGDIMPVWQSATIGSFRQLNKAIPLLLDMNGKMTQMLEMQGQMLDKQDLTIEEIKGLRQDMASQHEDIKLIKRKVGVQRRA
jgi:acylphosphatase